MISFYQVKMTRKDFLNQITLQIRLGKFKDLRSPWRLGSASYSMLTTFKRMGIGSNECQ